MSTRMHSPGRIRSWTLAIAAGVLLLGAVSSCENLDRYGPSQSAAPTGLVAVPASPSQIALAWSGVAGTGTYTYQLHRSGSQIATTQSTTHSDGGLSPSTTYVYSVTAVDQFGNVSEPSNPAIARTLDQGQSDGSEPTVPTGLNAVASSPTTISLSWNPSVDDVGVLGYRVYRGGTQIATTSSTTFGDQGLTPSTQYTYTAAAFDAAGNLSDESDPASATTLPAGQSDTQAPSVPLLVVAAPTSSTSVSVTWTASTDNVGVLGYRVYRGGVQIGTTPGVTYTDSNLIPLTTYSYTVAAYDAAGNLSGQSAPPATAITPP